MRTNALVLLGIVGVGAISSGAVSAQVTSTCRIQLDSARSGKRVEVAPGRIHQYGSGGVWARCIGEPTTLRSDSVAWYSELDRLDFVDSVRFRDSAVTLDADRARYFTADERLEAFGNIRLVNEETRSVLTGPNLKYLREASGLRDTAELFATGRPTVEYRSSNDTSGAPYVIVGDRVRLRGEAAWAGGTVTIDREDFAAKSDSAALNIDVGDGMLVGHAEAASRDTAGYHIVGRRIAFRLTDDRLTWVQAQEFARATSSEWQIVGDTIEFNVADDLIQGGSVWGDSTHPMAMSESYTIAAESLALDSPDQVLTEVRAFGTARATSQVDSLSGAADWMAGDTVAARFDSTEMGQRELVRLEARGNASAFYYIYENGGSNGPPAISYSRGERIIARFKDGELDRVDVVEAADGVYLEPLRRRRP